MKVKLQTFRACKEGRHRECRQEILKTNPDDVSEPDYKLKCNCTCHKPRFRVPAIYKMILAECRIADHDSCQKKIVDQKKNATYICTCKCHREN